MQLSNFFRYLHDVESNGLGSATRRLPFEGRDVWSPYFECHFGILHSDGAVFDLVGSQDPFEISFGRETETGVQKPGFLSEVNLSLGKG